jgi:hypothetical protein
MSHESDGHVSVKIGLTVCCLQCGKKFYIVIKRPPIKCPKCNRILGNKYEILDERYEGE